MKKIPQLVFVSLGIALSSILSGCTIFGAPTAKEKFGIIFPEISCVTATSSNKTLYVRPIISGPSTYGTKIHYAKVGGHSGTFQLSEWVEPPSRLLLQRVIDELTCTNYFSSISKYESSQDLTLSIEVLTFLYDASSLPGVGSVRYRAELSRPGAAPRVKTIEYSTNATSHDAEGAVQAILESTTKVSSELANWVVSQ
jgi:ABC-type uncharacterized transport system auxiliary subunit